MKPRADRILVIKLRAIGDVVLSTAVLPNIRKAYPSAAVHFLTERASAPVLEHHPDVDRILVLPGRGSGIARAADFYRGLMREKYDLVFDLFGNPRSAFLTLLSGAPARVGFSFRGRGHAYNIRVEPRGDRVHEVEFNLDALRAVDIPVTAKEPRMAVTQRGLETMDAWLEQTGIRGAFCVAMHVWGSWPAKRWEIRRFSELADLLIQKYQAAVIWTWGPGEEAYAREARSAAA
ncbi:glycosyltransferase family 9 protein, partial [bacterium]|nr:glycosyltransferase family 9 protein [bacterium]